jgi:hypothetical protein
MLDDAQLRAIARVERRVEGEDPVNLGTAFVVGDGLVLTAWHVVKDAPDGLWLRFGPDGHAEGPAQLVRQGAALDWAVLASEAARGVAPLRLRRMPGAPASWGTFGFFRKSGGFLRGPVRAVREVVLELGADEVMSWRGASAAGASGSPVIVRGAVVGIIVDEIRDTGSGLVVDGWLRAHRIERIVAEVNDGQERPSIKLGEERLPFQDAFAARLQETPPFIRDRLAERLELDDGSNVVALARALLRGGWAKIREVLEGVESLPKNAVLCSLAESLWVDDKAVETLLVALAGPQYARAAALNASDERTARHYVDRANDRKASEMPTWRDRVEVVTYTGPEVDGGKLVDRIRQTFALPGRDTDATIQTWARQHQPVVAVIYTLQPVTPDLVEEIHEVEKTFSGICPLVLTGPEMGELAPSPHPRQTIVFVRPALPPGREDAALQNIPK